MDDLESLLNDEHSLLLFAGVSSLSHESADQSLCNGTSGLVESLSLPFSSGVRKEDFRLSGRDRDVSLEGFILHFEIFIRPLSEEFLGCGELLLVFSFEVFLLVL